MSPELRVMARFSELKRKHPFPLLFLGFRFKKNSPQTLRGISLQTPHCLVAPEFLDGATTRRFVLVP